MVSISNLNSTSIHTGLIRSAVLLLVTLVTIPTLPAQQWPVDQIPSQGAVPQYIPSSKNQTPAQSLPPQVAPVRPQPPLPNFFDKQPTKTRPSNDGLLAPNPLANGTIQPIQNPSPQAIPNLPTPKETSPRPRSLPPLSNPRVNTPRAIAPPKITPMPKTRPSNDRPSNGIRDKLGSASKTSKPNSPANALIDYSLQRDFTNYPVDPRKPCPACSLGPGQCRCRLLGNQGQPFLEQEPGGCQCDSRHPWKHPDFSVHWPRPFSAKLDERHPDKAAARYSACPPKRAVDIFDGLSTFKLINYQRTDNGHSGSGADPYGCLGESKFRR